jgi:hypothetical protein
MALMDLIRSMFGLNKAADDPSALEPLLKWLEVGKPANITCLTDASKRELVERFYQERASARGAPPLKHYVLAARKKATFTLLVVSTGEKAAHHASYDAEGMLERVVPGGGWAELWGEGAQDRANFPMPGCTLETTAYFDEVAAKIVAGGYRVVRVIGPEQG